MIMRPEKKTNKKKKKLTQKWPLNELKFENEVKWKKN